VKREAKSRSITVEEPLEKIEAGKAAALPTRKRRRYDENKAQLGGQTLEQIKPRIVEYLKQQKGEERRQAFIEELEKKYKTTVLLRPPVVDIGTAGRPERGGGAKAPITIVEFSDYQCPFCKRAEESVDKVMKTYGDARCASCSATIRYRCIPRRGPRRRRRTARTPRASSGSITPSSSRISPRSATTS
jgi:plasmid stabilization system protein ParE